MTGRRSHGRLSALNGVVHQGTVSAVYMRSSKQRESAATLPERSAVSWPAGPQGAGASWARAKPLRLKLIITAKMALLMPIPFWYDFLLRVNKPSFALAHM